MGLKWTFGDVRVTQVSESVVPLPVEGVFPNGSVDVLLGHRDWLYPHFIDDEGRILLQVQSLLIESGGKNILVDTAMGPEPPEQFAAGAVPGTKYLDDLAGAGFERTTVDFVVLTHLHVDHVGWNTMRDGDTVVPTFPNARYIVAEPALQVWRDHDADATAAHGSTAAMEVPLAAGLVDVVATDHRLTDEVRLMSTPGHTTGHVSLMIESVRARALVTGDLTHHPVQWAEPGWGQATDHDVAESTRTRKWVLDEYGDTDVVLIGSHYAGPVAGRVTKRHGGRFLPLL